MRKEFIQLFRDKQNRPILIIAPFIQLLVFGYVVNYDIKDIRVPFSISPRHRKAGCSSDAFTANSIFHITHRADDPQEWKSFCSGEKSIMGIKDRSRFQRAHP